MNRQAGVAAETASLAASRCTPQACAARQVGADRWQGLGAPMDARCDGQVIGSSSLSAMEHHQGHLLLMCRIQEEAGTSVTYEHSLKNFKHRPEKSCLQQPFQTHSNALT